MEHFAVTRRLAKAVRQREENLHRDRMQFLPPRTIRSGYNCRGFVYLGRTDHPWEAVFDTGSTRNAVSLEFLKELLRDSSLGANVIGIWAIEPLPCVGMEAERTREITKAATLRITFREHGVGRSVAQE